MFYSGWLFRTPTCFDLSDRTTEAAGGTAPPPSGGSGLSAAVRRTAGGPIATGTEPVVLQRIESLASSFPLPAEGDRSSAPAAATSSRPSGGAPGLRGKGVVHLQLGSLHAFAEKAAGGEGAASRARSHYNGNNSAFHIRSDCPLMAQLGVAYMEVQIERLPVRLGGSSDTAEKATAAPLSLVVGICSDALPPHKLPGEQEKSAGLFYAQSMVYSDGTGEGERVSLAKAKGSTVPSDKGSSSEGRAGNASASPLSVTAGGLPGVGTTDGAAPPLQEYFRRANQSQAQGAAGSASSASQAPAPPAAGLGRSRRRELREGDTLGVLVNFIEGSLRFTYNGAIVDGYSGRVEKAEERKVSGAAGEAAGAHPGVSVAKGSSGKHGANNGSGYYFAVGLQKNVASPVTLKVIFQSGVLPVPGVRVLPSPSEPPPPQEGGEGEGDGDAGADLVVFDVARYATREAARRLKRQYPRLQHRSWGEAELDDTAVHATLRQFFISRGLSKSLAALERETNELAPRVESGARGARAPAEEEARDPLLEYSDTISEMRRLVLGTGTPNTSAPPVSPSFSSSFSPSFCPAFVLEHHCLLPTNRAAFYAALSGGAAQEALGPRFWGLLFFSRRIDILFTLKAMQAVELALDTCERYLAFVQQRHGKRETAPGKGDAKEGEDEATRPSIFDTPAAVESKLLSAYSAAVILPMGEVAKRATRRSLVPAAPAVAMRTSPPPPAVGKGNHSTTDVGHGGGAAVPPVRMHSWQELAQLPRVQLRNCFFDCLPASEGVEGLTQAGPLAERDDPIALAELAATVLLTAAVPLLAAPTTATQLRLGEAMVSLFSHTHTFFSQLTRGGGRRHDDAGGAAANASGDEEKEWSGGADGAGEDALLATCLRNWAALFAKVRQQYRRRTYAQLQRSLEECNQWVGITLRDWLSEKVVMDAEARQRAELQKRHAEAVAARRAARRKERQESAGKDELLSIVEEEDGEETDDTSDSAIEALYASEDVEGEVEEGSEGARTQSRGQKSRNEERQHPHRGVLSTFTHPPVVHDYLSQRGASDSGKEERGVASAAAACPPPLSLTPHLTSTTLLERLPPGQPSLRALYRRCLVTASLTPLAQVSTSYFLTRLSTAAKDEHGSSGGTGSIKGHEGEEASVWKRASAATAPTANGNREGWAADEFYLASVYLQRVHRYLFP